MPSARTVAVLLVLLGCVVVAHPLYLFDKHGQMPRYLDVSEADAEPSEGVVASADLPPAAKAAFDAEIGEESAVLWTGEDDAAIDALRDAEFVEHEGVYYRTEIRYVGGVLTGIGTSIRVLLTALGSLSLVAGLLGARTDSLRPLAPRRALAVPVVSAIGILATNLYDFHLSGASESFLMPAEGFGAVALVGVSLAAAARRGDARNAKIAVGVALAASAVLLVGLGADPIFGAIVGVPTLAASLVLGFLLADPVGV